MRDHDWTVSPLGHPETWPQALRLTVDLILASKFPMFVAWGPELGFVYNDAYSEILADKHPTALGRPFREVWAEIWDDISPLVDAAMAGEATYRENLPLVMNRKGFDEETWFTFSYSPVRGENGAIGGMFCAVAETTRTILAERAREESEGRLRLAIEGAKLGTWDWDLHNFRGTWSPRTSEILGYPAKDEVTVEQRNASIHPDDRARVWREFNEAIQSGDDLVSEYRALRPDGQVRWIASRGAIARDESGKPVRAAGIVVDVTESKLAEAALRESEARFRLMADAVPQIVWITDAEGRAEFFNKQWHDYTGAAHRPTTASEVAADYVHPDDAAPTMAAFDKARRSGTTFLVEHRIRSKDGAYRWFLVRGEPYRDPESNEIVRWFGASVDIHDRKVAEARLRELNETLEGQVAARSAERARLWNLSQDMLARADYGGMMSAVSPAWQQVLGWNEQELLSRGYASFMHPEDEPQTLAAIARMAETREPARFENRIATRDGGWKPIEWLVAPEPDGVNFIAVGRDLSHAKAREAELAVAQEALRQSQKMEAMGSLTGGVAHDFNNLLTPIIGSLDMLVRKGIGSERERRMIDGALQSAERAKTLVQRLLAFARRQPLQTTAVDVTALIDDMAGLISSTVGPTIDVRVDVARDLPPAMADQNQLEMALLNLAVNARDAMPEGGVLTMAAAQQSVRGPHPAGLERGHYIRLSVTDTGDGMDEATRARAVEPFFSTKGIGKGTGLGLSMVHGLAAQLGGGLTLDSEIGRGTSVTLWLPISAMPVRDQPSASDTLRMPTGRGVALLVDDEDLVRMSTADMLTELGFEVTEVGSPDEALALLREGAEADVLVTDHLMPGMSGVELADAARTLRPQLPVLLISGYADVDGIAPDLPRLTKPFRNAELASALSGLLPAAD
jgi:PAS domain S-box-containing protein